MNTDTTTVLLGVIAACAVISTLWLIGLSIVLDAHLTELRSMLRPTRICWVDDTEDDDADDVDGDTPEDSEALLKWSGSQ